MARQIVTACKKEDEAITAVKELEIEGYNPEDITVLTNKKNTGRLQWQTDVKMESGIPQDNRNHSFMEKIKQTFTDDITDPYDQLVRLGVPGNQAKRYQGMLKSGDILVTVEDK